VAEYVGLNAIAKRLGRCVPTVVKLHREEGLLLFRRRLARVGPGRRRWAWATTDELIHAWLVAKCRTDRAYIPSGEREGANRTTAGASRDS
jgi:hypothetical protein